MLESTVGWIVVKTDARNAVIFIGYLHLLQHMFLAFLNISSNVGLASVFWSYFVNNNCVVMMTCSVMMSSEEGIL